MNTELNEKLSGLPSNYDDKPLPEFRAQYERDLAAGVDMSLLVWQLANHRWTNGYEQGKNDPYFENESE